MSLFEARFYEFNVHLPPDADSLTRFALEAKRYGYSGIAVSNLEIDGNIPQGFSIYSAVEVSGKPSKLRDEVKRYRGSGDILIARGGDEEFNRAAVETAGLDILLQPAKFNHVLAKAAYDNSITLGFNAGSIIRLRGEARIRELRTMRANLKFARKYEVAMLLTCSPNSIYDLRSPREAAALASLFGMTETEAVRAMSAVPLDILKRKSPDYIQEGVEII
ncbi:MAG: ribonuclease P protein component 3 [Candidatus Methanoperedens sp.]|nr:ribonuclease P protein component 3 [Candidatus Methanoperedens sp.]